MGRLTAIEDEYRLGKRIALGAGSVLIKIAG
jgi:hypothetical protein